MALISPSTTVVYGAAAARSEILFYNRDARLQRVTLGADVFPRAARW